MPSFGEKLKREREKRSVTLEQISVSTKIGTRMLQALEEDKFSQLPGGIFNKGFVRAYAKCVGLDEDQAVADYLEASGEAPPPSIEASAASEQRYQEPASSGPSRDLPWGLFAAVLLVVALILSVWSYRKREHRTPHPPASSTLSDPKTVAAETTPSAGARPMPAAHSAASSSTPPAKVTVPAVTSVAPPQPGEFTVLIQARDDSWLSITADGKVLFSNLLTTDSDRVVHGRKEVVIRAGNTGALDFSFNGKKLASQGDYGEVKTLTFSGAGLVPNRPAAPPSQ